MASPLFILPALLGIGFFASFVSPFGLAYLLCTVACGVATAKAFGRRTAALAVSAGGVLLWTSILTTERRLPQAYPLELGHPNAEAGWPLVAFRYPIPPMGNDVPPLAQWPTFFTDYAFWLAVGLAVALLCGRFIPERALRTRFLLLPGVLVAFLGLGHTLLKFD